MSGHTQPIHLRPHKVKKVIKMSKEENSLIINFQPMRKGKFKYNHWKIQKSQYKQDNEQKPFLVNITTNINATTYLEYRCTRNDAHSPFNKLSNTNINSSIFWNYKFPHNPVP